MKTIYQVMHNQRANSCVLFESENRQDAREFFDKENRALAQNTPADTAGWYDNDLAWNDVYYIDLVALDVDDDGDVVGEETLATTDYYFI